MTLITNGSAFIGNEDDFNVVFAIVIDTTGGNSDLNATNNQAVIPFSLESEANINIDM